MVSALSPDALCLIISLIPAVRFPGCAPASRCAVCPFWGGDLWLRLSWWMSTIQDPKKTWLVTESLLAIWLGMPSLGPSLPLSFRLWLAPACLPASGRGWAGPQLASSLLIFSQSFVLWAGWQCLRLELFAGKFSLPFYFFPLWLSHGLGCYLTLAPSECSQGIQAQSLP